MASIGSLTTSTSTSIRGYGGLASGLDRDELIEGMTVGTTTKINQQEQKKQQIEWMQEAIQTISDKMISFHGKYTETLTSPTNLFSSLLWGRNKITTSGKYSSKVSVTGTANSSDTFTIMGIKQKAENAKWASSSSVSDNKIGGTGKVDIKAGDAYEKYNLDGTNLHLKYGDKTYTVTLSNADKYKYDSAENIADALNDQLKNIKVDDNTTLADVVTATGGANGSFSLTSSGEPLEVIGGTAAQYLFEQSKETDTEGNEVVTGWENSGNVTGKSLVTMQSFAEAIAGKSLTFSYNGTTATVKMPDKEVLSGKSNEETVKAIADSLQAQFDKTFGKGRIQVDGTGGELSFKTTLPGGGDDKSSTLTLTGGDDVLVGNRSVFKDAAGNKLLQVGDSTKLDLNAEISKAGITGIDDKALENKGDSFKINDKTFSLIKETITDPDDPTKTTTVYKSLNELMSEINKDESLDFSINYSADTDKFTFTSKDNGASGTIKLDKDSAELVSNLFGLNLSGDGVQREGENGDGDYYVRGQDAIVSIKYAGSDDPVEIYRDSNSFEVDGLTVNVKGTFGYDEDGKLIKDEENEVEVNATVDVDKLVDTIKSFVEEYNAIVDMVNKELTTKHESDYTPLSSTQKSELSEDEISKWEEKAKSGLLYGDSDLRNLSMDLRTVATSYVWQLQEVGISVSSNYADSGKLTVDETKLRSILESDPERVENLFTAKEGIGADGKQIYNGIATNLKNVMEKYVKTTGAMETKGILIRKAGSNSSAMSLTENYYYNQLQQIEKMLTTLNTRLETERDRYIQQFTSLETLINNMNSQASYLSSM